MTKPRYDYSKVFNRAFERAQDLSAEVYSPLSIKPPTISQLEDRGYKLGKLEDDLEMSTHGLLLFPRLTHNRLVKVLKNCGETDFAAFTYINDPDRSNARLLRMRDEGATVTQPWWSLSPSWQLGIPVITSGQNTPDTVSVQANFEKASPQAYAAFVISEVAKDRTMSKFETDTPYDSDSMRNVAAFSIAASRVAWLDLSLANETSSISTILISGPIDKSVRELGLVWA